MLEEELKPGDIRTFKKGKGKAIVLGVGVWAEKRGRQIHIHLTGTRDFHTTITSDPDSARYHRTLFRNLRKLLLVNEAWPFGAEGVETEDNDS